MPIRLTIIRSCFAAVGIVCSVLALGFVGSHPAIVWLWPWADGPLSYLFVASILAAFGIGSLIVAWNQDWRSAAGGGIALLIGFGGMAATLFDLSFEGKPVPMGYGVGYAMVAIMGLALWFWAAKDKGVDRRVIPFPVKLSSFGFAAALFSVGLALINQTEAIFPWPLKPATSMMYGWMFVGLSVSYLYLCIWGRWGDAKISLSGFLIYDLVLIGPFLRLFTDVKPDHWVSLVLYTLVLLYSGALAAYYLCVNRTWRLTTPTAEQGAWIPAN
jgi:hypothetical protein